MATIDQHRFTNMVRSLFNIDGHLLPELEAEHQREFVSDPVRYFMSTDGVQQNAIFREVMKRQSPSVADPELLTALRGIEQFFQRPDETSIDKFDRIAAQFHRETGIMAPGKSVSMLSGDDTPDDERRTRFDAWCAEKAEAARKAIAKASA